MDKETSIDCLDSEKIMFSGDNKVMKIMKKKNATNFGKQNMNYICVYFILWLVFLVIITRYYINVSEADGTETIYIVRKLKRTMSGGKVVSCYYNTPADSASPQLQPHKVDPHLCTHLNIAFARVRDKEIFLTASQQETIGQILQQKKINPELKVLLSVGGAGNNDGFSDMIVNHAARKLFIKSIKNTLRNNSMDGIDLDWEFPAVHQHDVEASKRERQHFSQLLREIRMEYIRERRGYLLTVALAAPQIIVDVAYDVNEINLYVDYANIMTYDFHYYSKFTPFTGLNSPIYPRNSEHFYMGTLNVNYTVQMYLSKGLNESKIVVGIPTYGHSFTLVNENGVGIGSPASGYGALGHSGFVNYPDICTFIRTNSDVNIIEENEAEVPYLYKDREWLSFDTPASVTRKAEYVKRHRLRGAMIYSLNSDDYEGSCGETVVSGKRRHFPLTASVKNVILQ